MSDISAKKLSLGTAQFGMDYGIANERGRMPKDSVFKVLEYASAAGMDTLDTAYEYGDSEEIIGEYLKNSNNRFKIISKMPKANGSMDDPVSYFPKSLKRLKQDKIHGYLVRDSEIAGYEELYKKLLVLKKDGLIEKIGLSLYTTDSLDQILRLDLPVDILQAPYNIFDRRFERYFPALRARGVDIHTRSVFLQGLFFLNEKRIAKDFTTASLAISQLRGVSSGCGVPIAALCLSFVMLNSNIDKVIIGVDSLDQLKENVDSLKYVGKVQQLGDSLNALELEKEEIILPYTWK
ncbi:MAG: aldo/keto reductase [Candidatus Omnitrophota bacterium]